MFLYHVSVGIPHQASGGNKQVWYTYRLHVYVWAHVEAKVKVEELTYGFALA